jgi:hypothetical protein
MTMDDWRDDAVALQREWAECFAARDPDRLAALYAEETAFYGSTADFHTTPAGVRSYFAGLPAGFTSAEFAPPHIVRLGADAMAASGEVVFRFDGKPIPYRMTHVLVRRDGVWKIATHHASPRP